VLGRWVGASARDVVERVLPRASDLGWLSRGDSVLLKVASNSPYRHPAVTWPEAVRAVVGFLKDRGAGTVLVGDQAGVGHVRLHADGRSGSTRSVLARNGLAAAASESGAVVMGFDDAGWDGYVRARGDFPHHWEDQLWLAEVLRRVDHVVNLPRLGAHALAGIPCAAKLAVGWLRDDSRRFLHQRGDAFYELLAEVSHFPSLRDKLRVSLTLGPAALLDIGPDHGACFDFEGVVALAAEGLLEHDTVASAVLAWADGDHASLLDLLSPYPERADFFNRKLVEQTWGAAAADGYRTLVTHPLGVQPARDRVLTRLATLRGTRPSAVRLAVDGDGLPEGLLGHLRGFGDGLIRV